MSILFKKDHSTFAGFFLFNEWLIVVSLEKTVYVVIGASSFP